MKCSILNYFFEVLPDFFFFHELMYCFSQRTAGRNEIRTDLKIPIMLHSLVEFSDIDGVCFIISFGVQWLLLLKSREFLPNTAPLPFFFFLVSVSGITNAFKQ